MPTSIVNGRNTGYLLHRLCNTTDRGQVNDSQKTEVSRWEPKRGKGQLHRAIPQASLSFL